MENITLQEVKALIESNRVVFAYPRKNILSVDGFKKFNAQANVFDFLKSIR